MWISSSFLLVGVACLVLGGYIPPGPKHKCPLPKNIWPCKCHSPTDQGLSFDCKDVSLATLSAALANPVGLNIPVTFLNISGFNTQKLYGTIFNNLNCTRIRIEGSALREIFSDVFLKTKDTLIELELVDTELEEFPIEALEELMVLQTLVLDRHRISNLSQPIRGLGSLKNLQISNGNITQFAKETFAAVGSKLVRLDLHGNQLSGIPKDAFQTMKNLEYLDVAFNNFDKLDPGYFFHLNKLTWFNGSHNAIPDFRRGAFARNSFLRVIHLTHNVISKIDAAAFRGMRLLVRLYLNDNKIAEVGRAAFNSLQRIKTIDLSRNKLKVLDFQMFLKLPYCEEILVQENNITTIKMGSFNELNSVLVNMSHNQISSIEKESFTNCVNMTVLDMSYNLLTNFTRKAFDENSYADEWRLDHNKLQLTSDIPLKFMVSLRILNVSYNNLREVTKNTFPKLYELHTVDFSHNNLSKIHSSVFITLFGLRSLDLRYNILGELTGSTLGVIPTLLELHLDYNRLRSVSGAAFTKLVSMRQLSVTYNNLTKVFQIPGSLNELLLSHNKISSLEKAWPQMNALQNLDLSSNQLGGNLKEGSFSNLAPLAKINLSNNNITDIPFEALADLRTCQYIDLSHNSITGLDKTAFGRLPVAFTIILHHNSISNISYKAFDGLIQLLHLDISNNALKEITGGAFANLVALRTLNLSHNAIERTENGTNCLFEDALSMESLDLSHNAITKIYQNSFPQHQWTNYKLAHLNLSHNQMTTVTREILRGTRTLLSLDLSHNTITEVKPNLLQNLGLLTSLSLAHNKLHSLEAKALGPPPLLSKLQLQSNALKIFPTQVLSRAPLSLINIESNRLRHYPMEFISKIQNGSRILTNENPLACDCTLIFLRRYFQTERPELSNFSTPFFTDYDNFECTLSEVNGGGVSKLREVPESQLMCDYSDDPLADKVKLPKDLDVDIRSWNQQGNTGQLRWRVVSKRDILGFILLVLGDNQVLKTEMYGYSVRGAGLNLPKGATQICLVPNFSTNQQGDTSKMTWDEVQKLKKACEHLDVDAVSSAYNPSSRNAPSSSLILSSIVYFCLFCKIR